jgi:hypothetical protein
MPCLGRPHIQQDTPFPSSQRHSRLSTPTAAESLRVVSTDLEPQDEGQGFGTLAEGVFPLTLPFGSVNFSMFKL